MTKSKDEGSITSVPTDIRPLAEAIGRFDGLPELPESAYADDSVLLPGGWSPALKSAPHLHPANDDYSMFDRAMAAETSTNPKRAFGVRKPSAQFIPPVALIEESVVMALGAAKYGAFNWQQDPVDATTYYSAAIRHLLQWFSGEDRDQESGASHLAHVRACMAILLDAQASGKLVDDRPQCASASAAIDLLKVAA